MDNYDDLLNLQFYTQIKQIQKKDTTLPANLAIVFVCSSLSGFHKAFYKKHQSQ